MAVKKYKPTSAGRRQMATSSFEEGCLSIPEVHGEVRRPESVLLRATTLEGDAVQVECSGLLARCLQHEIDHLDGVLFVDRLADGQRTLLKSDLRALEKRTRRELKRLQRRA